MSEPLTRADIEAMPAGREMDVAVARLIEPIPGTPDASHAVRLHTLAALCSDAGAWLYQYDHPSNGQIWQAAPFSTHLGSAMEALIKLGGTLRFWTIKQIFIEGDDLKPRYFVVLHGVPEYAGYSESLSVAICRALLLAKEGTV